MLPRLPNEPPPPARASASPGESAKASTVMPARRTRLGAISVRFDVGALAIWCLSWSTPDTATRSTVRISWIRDSTIATRVYSATTVLAMGRGDCLAGLLGLGFIRQGLHLIHRLGETSVKQF